MQNLLKQHLPAENTLLHEAMRYACLNGGKRLRPLLAYTTGAALGYAWEYFDPIALAIECLHCYSLIHDDLPAMDNDAFRRGQPTCHTIYGEAHAILAGDALFTLAFEILSKTKMYSPTICLRLIHTLTKATGAHGMVLGQAIDIEAQKKNLNLAQLTHMHRAKTGALIAASAQCAAIASQAPQKDLEAIEGFAYHIGLAFQIQDDILDELGNITQMGKAPGQDRKTKKCTFVSLLGLEQAKYYAEDYKKKALQCLAPLDTRGAALHLLAEYITKRDV